VHLSDNHLFCLPPIKTHRKSSEYDSGVNGTDDPTENELCQCWYPVFSVKRLTSFLRMGEK